MNQQSEVNVTGATSTKRWIRNFRLVGLVVVTSISLFIFKSGIIKGEVTKNGDLRILKSEVTGTAKFYRYTVDGVKMEVIAVRASDGTVRTALNTCQVCFDSGRGYYLQESNELICQNCGNRFQIDRVEKQKNGCNPVPITADLKTDDGTYITISKGTMVKAKMLFSHWKK